jgi:charged multivesicular body protein 1
MGNNPPPPKKPTMEDTLIEMKMASKRMARESAKSMKDSNAYMKKAKEALKKNNEEGAKLYLQSAASKRAECTCFSIQP